MANFDFKNLILINPCTLDDDCYARAMHAKNILDNAEVFDSFKKAIKNMDYLVATSSIESKNDKKHLRNALSIDNIADKLLNLDGKIGLIFGREDYGLYNEEIAECDTLIRIPTSESYLSMNLSHAVGIVLYSLFLQKNVSKKEKRTIGNVEKQKLYEFFSQLLNQIDYPEYKKEKTEIMFRRLMGRSMPSKWEYHNLMGVFSQILKEIEKQRK